MVGVMYSNQVRNWSAYRVVPRKAELISVPIADTVKIAVVVICAMFVMAEQTQTITAEVVKDVMTVVSTAIIVIAMIVYTTPVIIVVITTLKMSTATNVIGVMSAVMQTIV